jgi:hypothetical protein
MQDRSSGQKSPLVIRVAVMGGIWAGSLGPVQGTSAQTLNDADVVPMGKELQSLHRAPAQVAEEEIDWTLDAAVSSALFDRGEQIGGETVEFGAAVTTSHSGAKIYGSVYRLLPAGADQEAFLDEADYSVGVIFEGEAMMADLSANWLTYPGEDAEASLELMGIFDFDAPLAPRVIGFYDADFGDWGLEALVQPSWDSGGWTLYALGRTGFVAPGDGSANRSYVGIELGASRPLSENVEFGAFIRAEAADEDSYADKVDNGVITHARGNGMAIGLSLSVAR